MVGIEPESPGLRAGLREGDNIMMFKDQAVTSMDQLYRPLVATPIGVRSPLAVLKACWN